MYLQNNNNFVCIFNFGYSELTHKSDFKRWTAIKYYDYVMFCENYTKRY